jgi:hypothetical protein
MRSSSVRRTPGQTAANEEKKMLFKVSAHLRKVFALALVAAFEGLTLSFSPGVASASSSRSGALLVTKECSQYDYTAGSFCTITSSNLPEIPVGSKVVYAQAFGAQVPGWLDSDIVLVAGHGNTARGHCYLNGANGLGVCTFSGGTGKAFHEFHADVNVSFLGGVAWSWGGTYSFNPGH